MLAIGTKVKHYSKRSNRTMKGVIVYVHETRNIYSSDRITYGVRWSGGDTGDGWPEWMLTVID